MQLFVRTPFPGYQTADRISDPATVKEILSGPYEHHVCKVQGDPGVEPIVADPPAPELIAEPPAAEVEH